jgi:hypothetical protein
MPATLEEVRHIITESFPAANVDQVLEYRSTRSFHHEILEQELPLTGALTLVGSSAFEGVTQSRSGQYCSASGAPEGCRASTGPCNPISGGTSAPPKANSPPPNAAPSCRHPVPSPDVSATVSRHSDSQSGWSRPYSAARALGRIGPRAITAFAILEQALTDNDEDARRAAAEAPQRTQPRNTT